MKLTISQLVYAGFALVVATTIGVTTLVLNANQRVTDNAQQIRTVHVPGVILYFEMLDEISDMKADMFEYLSGDISEVEHFKSNHSAFNKYLQRLEDHKINGGKIDFSIEELIALGAEFADGIENQIFATYSPEIEKEVRKLAWTVQNSYVTQINTKLDLLRKAAINRIAQSNDTRANSLDLFMLDSISGLSTSITNIGQIISGYTNGYVDASSKNEFSAQTELFQLDFETMQADITTVQDKQIYSEIKALFESTVKDASVIFTKFDPVAKQQAFELAVTLNENTYEAIDDILNAASQHESEAAIVNTESTYQELSEINKTLLISTVLIAILSLVIAVVVVRLVNSRLNRIQKALVVANKIKDGDLSAEPIQVNTMDQIGELSTAINSMNQSLASIILQVSDSSSQVQNASESIHVSSQDSASNSSLQENKAMTLTASIEEMSQTAADVAEKSANAFDWANKSKTEAEQGGELVLSTMSDIESLSKVVQETSDDVERLGKRSSEIGDVIGVINTIADQTNLLALNAAIEAARAGEAGRGFAVVADEVRKLASSTSKATLQVTDTISAIQTDTEAVMAKIRQGTDSANQCVQQAKDASESFDHILDGFNQLNQMIESIATAAEEQSSVASSMTIDMTEVYELAKSNASTSHDVQAKCTEMKTLSDSLNQVVSRFTIKR